MQGLVEKGYEIVSTGGSARAISEAGVPVTPVDDVTQFPEMLGGRVKTLHPGVHGGILARRELEDDMAQISSHGITPIDIVVVNLYPFRSTVSADPPPEFAVGVENIDIGGPAMIRAAAKNHAHVTVVVDPSDYSALLESLGDEDGLDFRKRCAWKAFQVLPFQLKHPLCMCMHPASHLEPTSNLPEHGRVCCLCYSVQACETGLMHVPPQLAQHGHLIAQHACSTRPRMTPRSQSGCGGRPAAARRRR